MAPHSGSAGHRPRPRRRGTFLISAVGYETMARFRETLAPFGIHPRQFATMRALREDGGQSQRALSEGLHIPPSRLVALLDDLEAQGLVERRHHPTDRRARRVFLTRRGESLLDELFVATQAHADRALAGLTAAQRRQLDSLLTQVSENLALDPEVHPGMGS